MGHTIKYPTWQDVGLSEYLINQIVKPDLGESRILDYLVYVKVFNFQIKLTYTAICKNCNNTKKLNRYHEEYSICEKCGKSTITCSVSWRFGKNNDYIEYTTREDGASLVIRQMMENYVTYFKESPPDDFLKSEWLIDRRQVNVPKKRNPYGIWEDDKIEDKYVSKSSKPIYFSRFCCGEECRGDNQNLTIIKSALMCPFIWDDCFDWKNGFKKDTSQQFHITPILYMCSKMLPEGSSYRRKRFANDSNNDNDGWQALVIQPNQGKKAKKPLQQCVVNDQLLVNQNIAKDIAQILIAENIQNLGQ